MSSAILGRLGVALESLSNPGEAVLLANTAVSSLPASLTTQPNAVSGQSIFSGMRLLIVVTGNSTTGTITSTGKDFSQAQNAQSSTTPTIPVAGSASNPTGIFEYCTPEVYSVINSNGITVSGLTGGTVKIYGIQAASKLVPAMFEAEEKFPNFSPQEQRGLTSRDTAIQQLIKNVDISKIEQTFYPDNCEWIPFLVVGAAPSQSTIPASPTVLKASATVSGGPFSLTTQPNTIGPGELLQFVVTASSAVGTIVVSGTNTLGQAITETIMAGAPGASNGNGTWYSQQVFASVASSGVSFTGLTGGSCAINGYLATSSTWLAADSGTGASSSLLTGAFEWYDGTDAVVLPWGAITESTLEGGVEKEMKWTCKGFAQDMLTIGNRATTPQAASGYTVPITTNVGAFSNLWQPFDVGMPGWVASFFIDPLSGTAGTTPYNQVLDWKFTFKTPQKPSFTATAWQRFQRTYRQQRETELDLTIDFIDVVQYEQFRQQFVKQQIEAVFQNPAALGVNSSTPVFKGWTWIFNAKIIEAKRDPSKMEKVEATFKLKTEYTPSLGYEYKLTTINQQPPSYNQ